MSNAHARDGRDGLGEDGGGGIGVGDGGGGGGDDIIDDMVGARDLASMHRGGGGGGGVGGIDLECVGTLGLGQALGDIGWRPDNRFIGGIQGREGANAREGSSEGVCSDGGVECGGRFRMDEI
jgi:hypothetical protein